MPLSLTTASGLPRIATILSSSRATLAPDNDVSGTSARHSRVKSSTTHRMRKRRPQRNWIRALKMAVALRSPPRGCVFHSDRGSQYCSRDYQKILRDHGLQSSMSGKGNCYDCEYGIAA